MNKKLIIIGSIVLLVIIVILIFYFNSKMYYQNSMKNMINNYYQEKYYPDVEEQITKFKTTGIPITLSVLKNNDYNIKKYENKKCNLDTTYGLIKFNDDVENYKKDYTIEITLDCENF